MAVEPLAQHGSDHRKRLLNQAFQAIAWFVIWALILSSLTGQSFWLTFPALLAVAVLCGSLGLWAMTRWASERDSQLGQFKIATLLLMTFYAAVFSALVRWLQTGMTRHLTIPQEALASSYIAATIIGGFGTLVSIPLTIRLMDSLVWLAAWLLRKRNARRAGSVGASPSRKRERI